MDDLSRKMLAVSNISDILGSDAGLMSETFKLSPVYRLPSLRWLRFL